MRKLQLFKNSIVLTGILVLLYAAATSAISIILDGDQDSIWMTGGNGQIPGLATDGDEGGISDDVDIENVRWTNDGTDFFFLIDTYDDPSVNADIDICIDSDKDAGTDIHPSLTTQRDRCAYGSGVTGIDRVVRVESDSFGGVDRVRVWNVTTFPPTVVGSGSAGHVNPLFGPMPSNPVLEISVALSLLGFDATTCTTGIPIVVYYDGGDTNPDDNLPDSGSLVMSCGAPTAVTLSNSVAGSAGQAHIVVLLTIALALLASSVATVRVRRKATLSQKEYDF